MCFLEKVSESEYDGKRIYFLAEIQSWARPEVNTEKSSIQHNIINGNGLSNDKLRSEQSAILIKGSN